jgi:hypothetical protein
MSKKLGPEARIVHPRELLKAVGLRKETGPTDGASFTKRNVPHIYIPTNLHT